MAKVRITTPDKQPWQVSGLHTQSEAASTNRHNLKIGGISLIRYRDGAAGRQILGWPNSDYGIVPCDAGG